MVYLRSIFSIVSFGMLFLLQYVCLSMLRSTEWFNSYHNTVYANRHSSHIGVGSVEIVSSVISLVHQNKLLYSLGNVLQILIYKDKLIG